MARLESNSMYKAKSAIPIPPENWEPYKSRMMDLYLAQGKCLRDVQLQMKQETGFEATETQYRRQFNEVWKARKNLTKFEIERILQICGEREVEGKKTEVTLCAVVISLRTIWKRGTKRYQSVMEKIRANQELTAAMQSLPEEIGIRTPPPSRAQGGSTDLGQSSSENYMLGIDASPDEDWSSGNIFPPGSDFLSMADSMRNCSIETAGPSSQFFDEFIAPESLVVNEFAPGYVPVYTTDINATQCSITGDFLEDGQGDDYEALNFGQWEIEWNKWLNPEIFTNAETSDGDRGDH